MGFIGLNFVLRIRFLNPDWPSSSAVFKSDNSWFNCFIAGPQTILRPAKMLSHKTASSSAAVARGVSSSRVRPFTAAANRSSKAQQKQQRLVARAAEEEEQQPEAEVEEVQVQAIPEEEFVFSLSEAKKVCRNALWAGGRGQVSQSTLTNSTAAARGSSRPPGVMGPPHAMYSVGYRYSNILNTIESSWWLPVRCQGLQQHPSLLLLSRVAKSRG